MLYHVKYNLKYTTKFCIKIIDLNFLKVNQNQPKHV